MLPEILPNRVILAGGPRAGKTTLAATIAARDPGRTIYGTDSLQELEWSAVSRRTALWFREPGPWLIEGVATARAMRKWLRYNPTGAPADMVIYLPRARASRKPGQLSMAKGVETVLFQILPELRARGVRVIAE